jgi:hypothetical protein
MYETYLPKLAPDITVTRPDWPSSVSNDQPLQPHRDARPQQDDGTKHDPDDPWDRLRRPA